MPPPLFKNGNDSRGLGTGARTQWFSDCLTKAEHHRADYPPLTFENDDLNGNDCLEKSEIEQTVGDRFDVADKNGNPPVRMAMPMTEGEKMKN